MLLELLWPVLCLVVHSYRPGRFYDPRFSEWRDGKRCRRCGATRLER